MLTKSSLPDIFKSDLLTLKYQQDKPNKIGGRFSLNLNHNTIDVTINKS
jgi:hypothetical protein